MSNMTEEVDTDFQQAMQGVQRLTGLNIAAPSRSETQLLQKHAQRKTAKLELALAPWECLSPADRVRANCTVAFQHHSVTTKQLTRLQKGDFSTPCVIDLHGLTEEKAEERLTQWLLRCRHKTPRYALIIHGKGLGSTTDDPILKNFVNWWLRNQPRILAFSSALPNDGGAGAVYALLSGA
jgi:DNA-nicking Smr family endonuclease